MRSLASSRQRNVRSMLAPLLRRAASHHPDHASILHGMVLVFVFLVIGKLIGAGKEMAVAYRFGVSADLDAYLMVLTWVNVIVGVCCAALATALVPLWARAREDKSVKLLRFRSELFGFVLAAGALLAVAGWALFPRLLQADWLGLPPHTASAASAMAPWLVLLAPLGAMAGLFAAWILGAGSHLGTLLEGVPPLVIAGGVLLLAAPGGGMNVLVLSTLAGGAAYAACLAAVLAAKGAIGRPRLSMRSAHWPAFWHGMGLLVLGQAMMNSLTIVDQLFAVRIGDGSVAILGYSERITLLLVSLGGVAISRATLPVFSRAQAGGAAGVRDIVRPWIGLMFVAGIAVALLAWWLAPYLVQVLFERGAFTAEDTQDVTSVFRYGLLQLPFYFAGLVLISRLLSLGLRRLVAMTAITLFFVKIVGNLVLVPRLGLNGIVVSTTFMYMCSFALLWVLARRAERQAGN